MNDLLLAEHRGLIEELVARHIVARVEIVSSKAELGGKLGQSRWASAGDVPALIQLPARITAQEIEESLLALAVRGVTTGNLKLAEHADEIDSPLMYLQHLVLHEVAHVKNGWSNDRETDCDLWVYAQMHGET